VNAAARGLSLAYHNVFFSDNYEDEFNAVFRQRTITGNPTVYICAQDRRTQDTGSGPERLLLLVNAPPDGDQGPISRPDASALSKQVLSHLKACGLGLESDLSEAVITAPEDFHALFPATGGALYGRANHSPMASFARPGAASRIGGLYLAGGSVHPGPGVPMATLSGRLAAARLISDLRRGVLDRPA
jgi:1-hydroxycarotenoid 3,4-desaturase